MNNGSIQLSNKATEIMAKSNAMMRLFRDAIEILTEVEKLEKEIYGSTGGLTNIMRKIPFHLDGRGEEEVNKLFKRYVEKNSWLTLCRVSEISTYMSASSYENLRQDIFDNKQPVLTYESVEATLSCIYENRHDAMMKGMIDVFKRTTALGHKTQSGIKLKKRLILPSAIRHTGFNYTFDRHQLDMLNDIERFCDYAQEYRFKHIPENEKLANICNENALRNNDDFETKYFGVKFHLAGTVHLKFKDESVMDKLNKAIAKYYGEALGKQ